MHRYIASCTDMHLVACLYLRPSQICHHLYSFNTFCWVHWTEIVALTTWVQLALNLASILTKTFERVWIRVSNPDFSNSENPFSSLENPALWGSETPSFCIWRLIHYHASQTSQSAVWLHSFALFIARRLNLLFLCGTISHLHSHLHNT